MTSLRIRRPGRLVAEAVTLLVAAAVAFPLYWMVLSALKPAGEIQSTEPRPWTLSPSLDSFRRVFDQQEFGRYLLNSLIVAGTVVLGTQANVWTDGRWQNRARVDYQRLPPPRRLRRGRLVQALPAPDERRLPGLRAPDRDPLPPTSTPSAVDYRRARPAPTPGQRRPGVLGRPLEGAPPIV
ncbi:hypothetical protein SNARM312S_04393 [Streptomyces narbonensis]